jgi:hypothetical protein
MVIRFDATTGMPSSGRSRPVIDVNAARGTDVTMVGTRASCQPMPELMIVAPAASTAFPNSTISAQSWPSGTRSAMDNR